jgi:chromosome segregation ATPase
LLTTQDAVVEMSEQIDQLNQLKVRLEKDKTTVRMQLDDTKAASEHVGHEKSVAEKNLKGLDYQLGQLQKKIDDSVAVLCDYENQNRRLTSENANLFTRLEEVMGNASMMQKLRIQLSAQLDDVKRMCDGNFIFCWKICIRHLNARRKSKMGWFQKYKFKFVWDTRQRHLLLLACLPALNSYSS